LDRERYKFRIGVMAKMAHSAVTGRSTLSAIPSPHRGLRDRGWSGGAAVTWDAAFPVGGGALGGGLGRGAGGRGWDALLCRPRLRLQLSNELLEVRRGEEGGMKEKLEGKPK